MPLMPQMQPMVLPAWTCRRCASWRAAGAGVGVLRTPERGCARLAASKIP